MAAYRTCALVLLTCACGGIQSTVSPKLPAPSSSRGSDTSMEVERAVFRRVNDERRRVGCPELQWSEAASAVAEAHSADMSARHYFSHVSPQGVSPGQRLSDAGIAWSRIAENIAETTEGPEQAVRLWLGSAGHRANILNCSYTHTGIGRVADRWTQLFFTPAAR